MIRITDNGIYVVKDDVFNILVVPDVWSNRAVYSCSVTGNGASLDIPCTLFRGKYVRLFKEKLNLKAGTYNLVMLKDDEIVLRRE